MQRSTHGALSVLLAACLLLSGCGIGGCSRTEQAAQAPQYGVADMEKLVHAHPRYSDYFRLEQEYKNLVATYDAEREQLIRRSAQAQEALREQLSSGAIEKGLNTEYRAKMTARETAWNQKLEALYREWIARAPQPADEVLQKADLEIVNLQLKLRALHLPAAEREAMEARLQELLAERAALTDTAAALPEEGQKELAALKEKAQADLARYSDEVIAELSAQRESAQRQLHDEMSAQLMSDGAGWNHEWRETLATKQNEMNQVKEEITQDIRHEAQAVAEAKNLEVIFAEYRANISAQDVTNDILQKLGTNPKEVSNSGK